MKVGENFKFSDNSRQELSTTLGTMISNPTVEKDKAATPNTQKNLIPKNLLNVWDDLD